MKIVLRDLCLKDLDDYHHWQLPHHKYHEFNGPYYGRETKEEVEIRIKDLRKQFEAQPIIKFPNKKWIVRKEENKILGEMSWYWKSEETNWMEIGVVIYDELNWSKGIGFKASKLWVDKIFVEFPNLVRLGFSTWSGNIGMMKLAEKLGFKQEACYRKARIVDGEYFDSVSFGVLREEWLGE